MKIYFHAGFESFVVFNNDFSRDQIALKISLNSPRKDAFVNESYGVFHVLASHTQSA